MHRYAAIFVHVTFATLERRPLITADIRPALHAYLGGIARNLDAVALACGGVEDHVHVLARIPSTMAVAGFIDTLKSNSSRWLHQKGKNLFNWQRGYGAFSVSRSDTDAVISYIRNQEEHHRKKTWDEEFDALLRQYGLER